MSSLELLAFILVKTVSNPLPASSDQSSASHWSSQRNKGELLYPCLFGAGRHGMTFGSEQKDDDDDDDASSSFLFMSQNV
eukprot:scaffold2830_cov225-Chaetoceros_neogracile.AAC.1